MKTIFPAKSNDFGNEIPVYYPGKQAKSVTFIVTHNCQLRCSYCVDGDTEITMSDFSSRKIKDVRIGDKLLAFNEMPSDLPEEKKHYKTVAMPATVTKTFVREVDDAKELTFDDGTKLIITPNHPIFTGEFVPAGDIEIGTFVYSLQDSGVISCDRQLVSVQDVGHPITVYNLETTTHTYVANGICVHNCYEHSKCDERMQFDTACKFIDILFDLDAQNSPVVNSENAHCLILDFIGGEPLLEIELIDKIMDYFMDKALRLNHRWALHHYISISTNGWDYFDPRVDQFVNKHYGRISIGVTVDGNKQLHDACRHTVDGKPTYDRAAAAFADVQKRFGYRGTKLTIARANLPYLFEACRDMITNFNLTSLYGNPVFEEEWDAEDANLYYDQLKQLADWLISTDRWKETHVAFFDDFIGHPIDPADNQNFCGGDGKMLALDVDGRIYPCLRYAPLSMGAEKSAPWVLGDVEHGLLATDYQKQQMNCLNCITRRSQSTDECFNCPIGSGCAWCTAWNCELFGTPDKRCTRICDMHKARVMAASYYYNTIYRKNNDPTRFELHIPAEWAMAIVGRHEWRVLQQLARP